jgi:aldose sugar dehydrogenase
MTPEYDRRRILAIRPLPRPARTPRFPLLVVALGLTLGACDGVEPRINGLDDQDRPPGATDTHDYTVNELVDGLEHPWGMAFLPNGDILVTERPGRVRLVRDGELVPEPVEGGPQVWTGGQGGLLDIELHPEFQANGWVYLSYSKQVEGGVTTAVARARWDDGRLVELEDVFVADAVASGGAHFGSRIVFDRQGMMYVTVGDRGQMSPAQDLSNHIGTTLRLHDDGSAPQDNPFVGEEGALDEIFTYGNRNAQGMAVHPETGEVWQNEHGPRGGDELNRMVAGADYGWPDVSFGDHYDGRPIDDPAPGDGTEHPVVHWIPALAPSGLAFYTGDVFPNWRGSVLNGGLVARQIRRVVLDGDQAVHEEPLLEEYGARIRDVGIGPDGYVYFLTDHGNGVLGRLEPADGG